VVGLAAADDDEGDVGGEGEAAGYEYDDSLGLGLSE
jgi:hypothetical protein